MLSYEFLKSNIGMCVDWRVHHIIECACVHVYVCAVCNDKTWTVKFPGKDRLKPHATVYIAERDTSI